MTRTCTTRTIRALGTAIATTMLILSLAPGTANASANASPAVARIMLRPMAGPPGSQITIRGRGFVPGETVAFYFDGVRFGSTRANSTGGFRKRLAIPTYPVPGDHPITAVGITSGRTATAIFTVRTDWIQGCFGMNRACFNPYENVLDPAHIVRLQQSWDDQIG